MATFSPLALKYSAMFLALLRAKSITALSFWLTWMATLCWALALGLLGLVWAACLVWAWAGAPVTTVAATAVAAAIAIANLLRRAMVMGMLLGSTFRGSGRTAIPPAYLSMP